MTNKEQHSVFSSMSADIVNMKSVSAAIGSPLESIPNMAAGQLSSRFGDIPSEKLGALLQKSMPEGYSTQDVREGGFAATLAGQRAPDGGKGRGG